MMRSVTCVLLLIAVLAPMPGCIVRDMRDNMVLINEQMLDVSFRLEGINKELVELRKLSQTNESLEDLRARLEVLESINDSLEALRVRLEMLDSINDTLGALDKHLASLRKTLQNIDKTIPFLKLADDEEEEGEEGAEPGTAPPGDAPAPTP